MTSNQRAYLRSLANKITPIFQVGKNGIANNILKQIDDALEARELIKINVLETAPNDIKLIGEEISSKTNSVFVQSVGNKITLYRPSKKNPKIELPKSK